MNYLRFLRTAEKPDNGFTVVELMVAILIGLIVMAMCVGILAATNSTSLRVLAKSEAQQNTRESVGKFFADLADADSLLRCRISDTKAGQDALALGQPLPAGSTCIESIATGYVVAIAAPNIVCYYKTPKKKTAADLNKPPSVTCISRGGGGQGFKYSGSKTTVTLNAGSVLGTGISLSGCIHNVGSDPQLVYQYDCAGSGSSYLDWPNMHSAGTSHVVADLGSLPPGQADPKDDLFSYDLDGLGTTSHITASIEKLISMDVNMTTYYRSHGTQDREKYIYNETIILRGSERYKEITALS
jgi:prepilin-type N-terminal cleavage/methylation domain-containing protein